MKRFTLTGAPDAGKTSIIRQGFDVVEEAATDVIAAGARGARPLESPTFIDRVVSSQRQRQLPATTAAVDVQFHDRSPICTYGLSRYLGRSTSSALATEIDRIMRERVFERDVFFVRNLGFCKPTAARKISFEQSLDFERPRTDLPRNWLRSRRRPCRRDIRPRRRDRGPNCAFLCTIAASSQPSPASPSSAYRSCSR
jgi:predicted ATPase